MERTLALVLRVTVAGVATMLSGAPGDTVAEQRAQEATCDKLNVRHSSTVMTDSSEQFIRVPDRYPDIRDFEVAKAIPKVDFSIVQGLRPEYLREQRYGGWGDVAKGPDGCFYFSIGNHMSYGGDAYIIRYDPKAKTQSVVLRTKALIGWQDTDFGDGKLHGDLDVGSNGDIWALTYFGPGPTATEWDSVYRGGWLIRYNVLTGSAENLGIALEGDSWPYHAWDWQRDVFFGVGNNGFVFVFDTKARKMVYGGAPPSNIHWYERAVLLDRDTGLFYTTDSPGGTVMSNRHVFVQYVRRNNQFIRMPCETPRNPISGKSGPLRAHTKKKDGGGAFWCFDAAGTLFKFYPSEARTELVGIGWGRSGVYTPNMELSPRGRYVYYVPGAGSGGHPYGTPLVQYDTIRSRKKVIAFLYDYYLEKYGYGAAGTYGVELDPKGESLFLYTNGLFTTREKGTGYGRPALFHVHIPASEREE